MVGRGILGRKGRRGRVEVDGYVDWVSANTITAISIHPDQPWAGLPVTFFPLALTTGHAFIILSLVRDHSHQGGNSWS